MAKLTFEIPDSLLAEIRQRVENGEFLNDSAVTSEALRYYFDRHRPEDWDDYVRKEVAWSRRRAG
jgi:Arc/MetJ-type ribon-helix-helix transcriptional regulator